MPLTAIVRPPEILALDGDQTPSAEKITAALIRFNPHEAMFDSRSSSIVVVSVIKAGAAIKPDEIKSIILLCLKRAAYAFAVRNYSSSGHLVACAFDLLPEAGTAADAAFKRTCRRELAALMRQSIDRTVAICPGSDVILPEDAVALCGTVRVTRYARAALALLKGNPPADKALQQVQGPAVDRSGN